VKTKSTAYSGSTAMIASTATARPAETSTCAASAAHASRNAAPTMASPYTAAATGGAGDTPSNDKATPGAMTATAKMPSGGGIRHRGASPPVMTGDPGARCDTRRSHSGAGEPGVVSPASARAATVAAPLG